LEARKQQPPEVNWTTRQTVAIYAAAGLVYVALGIFIPELLFSWWEGVPFLLLSIWAAHRIWRRLA
jgi:uncharacterized membrane protein YbaN (DUF454 family)